MSSHFCNLIIVEPAIQKSLIDVRNNFGRNINVFCRSTLSMENQKILNRELRPLLTEYYMEKLKKREFTDGHLMVCI